MSKSNIDDNLLAILVFTGVFLGLLGLSFTNTGSVLFNGLGNLFRAVLG